MKIMESNFEQELATKAMKRKERAEGEAIGIVKGKAEERVKIAQNMIKDGGVSYDLIAKFTGLTSAEVAQLATT